MTARRKELLIGVSLLVGFAAVLAILFIPILNGKNLMQKTDDLYNSISKGSVYYIPELREASQNHKNKNIKVSIKVNGDRQAKEVADLFAAGGAHVELSESSLKISGKLGEILSICLEDADYLFHNEADTIRDKYGYHGRRVLYNWWIGLKDLDRELTRQKRFKEAKFVSTVLKKGVECSYNYYKIEPLNISDKVFQVVLSLVFYVVYTVWFGFAIMYLLMGLGFKLGH